MRVTILVVGTGAVANAVCVALARSYPDLPLDVTVAGRRAEAAQTLAFVGNSISAASASPVQFTDKLLEGDDPDFVALLRTTRPDVVLCAASLSSSWEQETRPSAWTRATSGSGFGLTVPFHFFLVARLADAIHQVTPKAFLVNACYPDLINRLLKVRSTPATCGIGNVSTTALAIQSALGHATQDRLSVVAHHRHLYRDVGLDEEAMLWLDGTPRPCGELLQAQRASPRPSRYPLIGAAFAELVLKMHDPHWSRLHLPGVDGMMVGCRVTVGAGEVLVDLPTGCTREQIDTWGSRYAEQEGAIVDGEGRLQFTRGSGDVVRDNLSEYKEGVPAQVLTDVLEDFTHLRDRLRSD